jgi:hypothetical protein
LIICTPTPLRHQGFTEHVWANPLLRQRVTFKTHHGAAGPVGHVHWKTVIGAAGLEQSCKHAATTLLAYSVTVHQPCPGSWSQLSGTSAASPHEHPYTNPAESHWLLYTNLVRTATLHGSLRFGQLVRRSISIHMLWKRLFLAMELCTNPALAATHFVIGHACPIERLYVGPVDTPSSCSTSASQCCPGNWFHLNLANRAVGPVKHLSRATLRRSHQLGG